MGYLAHTDDARDVTPSVNSSLPPAPGGPRGVTTGTVTRSRAASPLANVKVGLASLVGEAGFPDELATRTAANGSYALDAPVGTYGELVVEHPGYSRVALPGFVVGGTRVQDVALRRDWAARAGGGVVSGSDNSGAPFGCGLARLNDQRLASGWSAINSGDPSAVVQLPQAIDVTGFGLDPTNACGNDSGAATRDYRVETSSDGANFTTALEGSFGPLDRGRLHVLPSDARNVKWVRLTLRSPMAAGSDYVDFSELEVYGVAANQLPAGSLAASRLRLTAGGTVDFAASFTDPDSRIVGYDWDFDGDGAVDRSTAGPSTSFAYSRVGGFAASVAVRDYRGGVGSASRAITVTPRRRPVVRLPRRGRRGRATARVTCAERCVVTARLRVDGRVVRTARRTLRTTRRAADHGGPAAQGASRRAPARPPQPAGAPGGQRALRRRAIDDRPPHRAHPPLSQANSAAQVRLPTLPSTGRFHGGPWRRRWNVRTIRSVRSA